MNTLRLLRKAERPDHSVRSYTARISDTGALLSRLEIYQDTPDLTDSRPTIDLSGVKMLENDAVQSSSKASANASETQPHMRRGDDGTTNPGSRSSDAPYPRYLGQGTIAASSREDTSSEHQ